MKKSYNLNRSGLSATRRHEIVMLRAKGYDYGQIAKITGLTEAIIVKVLNVTERV